MIKLKKKYRVFLLLFFVWAFYYYVLTSFYVRFEDQHGDPIAGVKIYYGTARINRYFGGKGRIATTNRWGYARLRDQSTVMDHADKEGYIFYLSRQFRRDARHPLIAHNVFNPLVIDGWKIVEDPDLDVFDGAVVNVGIYLPCTFIDRDFEAYKKMYHKPLKVELRPQSHDYTMENSRSLSAYTISVPNFYIEKTNDLFLGYPGNIDFRNTSSYLELGARQLDHYYLKSKDGNFYGALVTRSRVRDSVADIDITLWFNLRGEKHLQLFPKLDRSYRQVSDENQLQCVENAS